jgi:solute carrier family 25 thiamine pyrophosphate transporter 19
MSMHSSIADDSPHWHKIVAGAIAGGGARLFTAPLDLLRIRRQLYPSSTPSNMFTSLHNIASTEGGIHALFRGNVAATYLWMGYAAVQFSMYDYTAHYLFSSSETISPTAVAFVSGASAGVCATLATYPLDICRTAFAAQGLKSTAKSSSWRSPTSMAEFAKRMHIQLGWKGFFAGSGPAVVQIIPYMGLNFMGYEILVSSDITSVGVSGGAGAISGGMSKIIVYPLDTVKKRMQVQAVSGHHQYRNMMDCLMTIVRTEGVNALYNGLVPSVAKNTIGTGLSFAFFTLAKNSLAKLDPTTTTTTSQKATTNRKQRPTHVNNETSRSQEIQ